jgi:hypothetical protein
MFSIPWRVLVRCGVHFFVSRRPVWRVRNEMRASTLGRSEKYQNGGEWFHLFNFFWTRSIQTRLLIALFLSFLSFFLKNNTVQHRRSQHAHALTPINTRTQTLITRTHTHPYKHTYINPTLMSTSVGLSTDRFGDFRSHHLRLVVPRRRR